MKTLKLARAVQAALFGICRDRLSRHPAQADIKD